MTVKDRERKRFSRFSSKSLAPYGGETALRGARTPRTAWAGELDLVHERFVIPAAADDAIQGSCPYVKGRADMDVYEAVASRRAVRAFSDEPVPRELLERVLTAANRAPSSGNLQPWHVYAVAGEPLAELKRRATARALTGDPGDGREYPMYPAELTSPYVDRFSAAAAQRYKALGIERDDPERPMKMAALNSQAFEVPVVLFCYLDRTMGPGQWGDAGMHLQTVMLLLRAEGLHSCPQVMWTMYRKTVSRIVGADDGLVLFCGVAVGFEKEGVPQLSTGRADMTETVSFIGV